MWELHYRPQSGRPDRNEYEHGVAILATGGHEWQPDVYAYGQDPRIMTALELDVAITANDYKVVRAQTAVFIQCVGSREPERPYCSKVCCTHSVESALALKKINPEMDIFIIYRDIRTFGVREDLYREARDKGIFFIRFDLENKPEVQVTGDQLTVTVIDHVLGQPITLSADLVTLASAIIPNPVKDLVRCLQDFLEQRRVPAGGPHETAAGGFRHRWHLSLRFGPLPQTHR